MVINDFNECFRNNEKNKGNEVMFNLHNTPFVLGLLIFS
jgi:hypothetical protein